MSTDSTTPASTSAETTPLSAIPGVGKPCQRALADAGYANLESLAGARYPDLLSLHGVGARGLERLNAALQDKGLSLTDAPTPPERTATFTRGHTGDNAADLKTHATAVNPAQFIEELPWARCIEHGRTLLELFARATGEEPVMWGPMMIGYGQCHYTYATGREGDTFIVGFSPRQAKISLYGLPKEDAAMARLGKYSAGVSCMYVNKLEDIDLAVLEQLVATAYHGELRHC